MESRTNLLSAGDRHVGTYATVDQLGSTRSFAVTVRGRIDRTNVGRLREAFRRAHLSGAALVHVDLTGCDGLDPSAMSALLGLERRVCRSIGRDLLLSPSPALREVLSSMGLDDYFPEA